MHQQKEEERGLFLFLRFWGKLSYMSGKIILYDRENYKQARKNLLLDSFYEVLESEKFHYFRRIILGANFRNLNNPYTFKQTRLNDCKRAANALRRKQSGINRF